VLRTRTVARFAVRGKYRWRVWSLGADGNPGIQSLDDAEYLCVRPFPNISSALTQNSFHAAEIVFRVDADRIEGRLGYVDGDVVFEEAQLFEPFCQL